MNDPAPENIVGEKTVSHVVEHSVRWDYVLLAVAGIYAAWKVAGLFNSADTDTQAVVQDGVEVLVDRENNQGVGLRTER